MNAISKILVPIDFLPHSAEAVQRALDLASPFSAEVVLLHVYQPAEYPLSAGDIAYDDEQFERVSALARQRLDGVRREVDPIGRRGVKARVVQGDPVEAIIEASQRDPFDLIVMGTHGRTGMGRLFAGSIAEEVIRRAPCAVLTVKAPRPAPSLRVPRRRPAEVKVASEPVTVSRAAAFLSMLGAPGTSIARAFSKPWR